MNQVEIPDQFIMIGLKDGKIVNLEWQRTYPILNTKTVIKYLQSAIKMLRSK
jgi:hypothetical protein